VRVSGELFKRVNGVSWGWHGVDLVSDAVGGGSEFGIAQEYSDGIAG
jgi:hypothetical protein